MTGVVDFTLLHGAIERLDCGVTALSTLAAELADDGDDGAEVAALKWLFSVMRDEVHNVRNYAKTYEEIVNNPRLREQAIAADGVTPTNS